MNHKTPAYLKQQHDARLSAARRHFDALTVEQQTEAVEEFATLTGRPTFYSAATCDTIAHMPAFLEFVARRVEERGGFEEEDDDEDDDEDEDQYDDDEDANPFEDDEDDADRFDDDDDDEDNEEF